ncbi:hypothetical protein EDB86DRAFT_2836960 [Lactarius hatsudake]|nr:hypothetical protein EDB86DRAFT_2836960 [Lactarius hatsudake]
MCPSCAPLPREWEESRRGSRALASLSPTRTGWRSREVPGRRAPSTRWEGWGLGSRALVRPFPAHTRRHGRRGGRGGAGNDGQRRTGRRGQGGRGGAGGDGERGGVPLTSREGSEGRVPLFMRTGWRKEGTGRGGGDVERRALMRPPSARMGCRWGRREEARRRQALGAADLCAKWAAAVNAGEALRLEGDEERWKERKGGGEGRRAALDPVAEAKCACHVGVSPPSIPVALPSPPSPFAKEDGPRPHPLRAAPIARRQERGRTSPPLLPSPHPALTTARFAQGTPLPLSPAPSFSLAQKGREWDARR